MSLDNVVIQPHHSPTLFYVIYEVEERRLILKMKEIEKIKPNTKICKKCNRELPLDTDHFYHKKGNEDGFTTQCKECHGFPFTDKLNNIPKDGYIYCNKCKRELQFNSRYFPIDNNKKDGLRKTCRECCGSAFLTKELKSVKTKEWSDDEVKLLKENYQNYTDDELIKLFLSSRTKKSIGSKAKRLGLPHKKKEVYERSIQKMAESKREYYKTHDAWIKGKTFSEETKKKMSESKKKVNKWKGEDNPRHKNPLFGKENGRWQGGITDLYKGLRNEIGQWQRDSMEFCQYKCVITNGEFEDIHHTMPFKDIMFLTFKNLNIKIKLSVRDYFEKEFNIICKELNRLHELYGFGACLDKEVHKLFHDNYGYTKVGINDFLDFIYRIDIGEFDKWFKDHNKQIKINYNYIKYLEEILFSLEEMAA